MPRVSRLLEKATTFMRNSTMSPSSVLDGLIIRMAQLVLPLILWDYVTINIAPNGITLYLKNIILLFILL